MLFVVCIFVKRLCKWVFCTSFLSKDVHITVPIFYLFGIGQLL